MIQVLQGDCREVLRRLPDASVHTVVTSPPYFGLRDYGTARWEGGSPTCDHVVSEIRTGQGMAALGEQYRGGGKKAGEPQPILAKDVCPRCGAQRVDRQLGLEATPDEYVAAMVMVFREVYRVLRDDGTLWLNIGDSYASSGGHSTVGATSQRVGRSNIEVQNAMRGFRSGLQAPGLKSKDLLGIPWMLAFALRADGWYLRSDIIWSKPNPMPESVTDRPTNAHEHLFLLAKSGDPTFWTHRDGAGTRVQPEPDYRWIHKETGEERTEDPGQWPVWRRVNLWRGRDYFYDAEAIAEGWSPNSHARLSQDVEAQIGSLRANGGRKTNGPMKAIGKGKIAPAASRIKYNDSFNEAISVRQPTRNSRSVWTITTRGYTEAHFATFPPELPERCIKAGTSEKGCCASCGAPWRRVITKGEPDLEHRRASGSDLAGEYNGQSTKGHDDHGVQNASDVKRRILEGMREKTYSWEPTCACGARVVPCTVLDPFAGAFTSMLVADRLQRDGIGIELSQEYCEMARRRLLKDAPLLTEITKPARKRLFGGTDEQSA